VQRHGILDFGGTPGLADHFEESMAVPDCQRLIIAIPEQLAHLDGAACEWLRISANPEKSATVRIAPQALPSAGDRDFPRFRSSEVVRAGSNRRPSAFQD
jgi:hypothetical protein